MAYQSYRISDIFDELVGTYDQSAPLAASAGWGPQLEQAWDRLLHSETVCYNPTTGFCLIQSATTQKTYETTPHTCTCLARGRCWHRAQARLIALAVAGAAPRARPAPQRIPTAARMRAQAKARADMEALFDY